MDKNNDFDIKDNSNSKKGFSFIKNVIIGLPFESYNNKENYNPELQKKNYYEKIRKNGKNMLFDMIVLKKPELINELDIETYRKINSKENFYYRTLCGSIFLSMGLFCLLYILRKKIMTKTLVSFQIISLGLYNNKSSNCNKTKEELVLKYDSLLNVDDFQDFLMKKSNK
jgi:hypothetical protein